MNQILSIKYLDLTISLTHKEGEIVRINYDRIVKFKKGHSSHMA